MLEKLAPYIKTLKSKNISWFEVIDAITNIIRIYDEEKENTDED